MELEEIKRLIEKELEAAGVSLNKEEISSLADKVSSLNTDEPMPKLSSTAISTIAEATALTAAFMARNQPRGKGK